MAAMEAVLHAALHSNCNIIKNWKWTINQQQQPTTTHNAATAVCGKKVAMINGWQENCNHNEKKPVVTSGDKSSNSNMQWQKLQPSQHSDCNRVDNNNELVTMINHQQ